MDVPYSKADVCGLSQAVEAKVLENLSEQTTAEKSAAKTAQDIKALRKQGVNRSSLHMYNCPHHLLSCTYSSSVAVTVVVVRRSCSCQMQLQLHQLEAVASSSSGDRPLCSRFIQVICIHACAAFHMAAVCTQSQTFHSFSKT